jgi:two-component system, OmpR family, sensor histidine kinase KdpD
VRYAAESAIGYLVQMTGVRLWNFCSAAAGIALLTAELLDWYVALSELSLIFLTAVLFSVATWRLGPSIFASITSVPTYDFFFIPPLCTLSLRP